MFLKTAFVDRAARLVLPAFACAGLLFVAGCETLTSSAGSESAASDATRADAGKEPQASPAGASPTTPPGADQSASPPAQSPSTASPAGNPGTPPDVAALPPQADPAPPPEPVVNSDPKQLLGLGQEELTDLLGTPAFLRQDAPAQLWRYRGENCRIDLFLYREEGTDPARYVVRYYAVRSDIEPPPSADDCLKGMLIARLPKQTG